MGTLKSFAALLLSVAALLTSVLALNAAQKKAEMQKAAAQTVTKAVVAAQHPLLILIPVKQNFWVHRS